MSILRAIGLFTTNISTTLCIVTIVMTGNAIGKSNKKLALKYFDEVIMISIISWLLVSLVLISFQRSIQWSYATDPIIIEELKKAWYAFIAFHLVYTYEIVQSGVIRGTGKIMMGALLACSGYILVGAPLSILFAYPMGLGINGIWFGACICSLYLMIGFKFLIDRIDWE